VVTGSSKGIGKAIAVEFAKGGYNIVLNARDENGLSDAVTDLKNIIGGDEKRITYLAGDISKENICSSLIEHTIKTFGRIDVLINNAGIASSEQITLTGYSHSQYSTKMLCTIDMLPLYCDGSPIVISGLPAGKHTFTIMEPSGGETIVRVFSWRNTSHD
jgi:NAD(P)-dependent dehydrogenase (short-subunit alcohol dehydrogenase family)